MMQNNQNSHKKVVCWGVISTANIGVTAISPAIQASSNGELVAVGSRDTQRAAELYGFVPNIRIYDDYESIFNDPDIDAIYVPLPNSLHAQWTIKALQAGKHVLCEKPLAVTVKEAETMVEAARANHVLLMEAFMYRFHPQIIWTLEQVKADLIGPVRLVRTSFSFDIRSRPDNIRVNPALAGGSLMDTGCYLINFCHAVYEQAPQMVTARVHVLQAGGIDMATNAILDFGDGRFGLIDASLELPRRQVAEIIGETGSITIPLPFGHGAVETVVSVLKDGEMREQSFPRVDQYQLEVEHFADCILSGKEPAGRLSETLENIATIEAIYQSAGHDWPIA